jgi:hypothetical protein
MFKIFFVRIYYCCNDFQEKFDYELVKLGIKSGSVFIDEKSAKFIKMKKG